MLSLPCVYMDKLTFSSQLIEDHRSTLFMKGALPYLYVLIFLYAQRASAKQSDLNFVSSAKLLKMVSEILRNVGSILFYIASSGQFYDALALLLYRNHFGFKMSL